MSTFVKVGFEFVRMLFESLVRRTDTYDEVEELSRNGIALYYYPTTPRRVQITPKMSTNMTRYLYSRGPVRQVCLLLTNQLAGFPAPIPFRFAYFCHAFPVKKYPRNSPTRT